MCAEGRGDIGNSVLSAQFLCQPKTTLNITVYQLKKNGIVAKTMLRIFLGRLHFLSFLELFWAQVTKLWALQCGLKQCWPFQISHLPACSSSCNDLVPDDGTIRLKEAAQHTLD